MKNRKAFFVIFSSVVLYVCFLSFINRGYDIRAYLKIENLSAFEIDKKFSDSINEKLNKMSELSDVLIFSKSNGASFYAKIKPFVVNKKVVIEKIKTEIMTSVNNFNEDVEITFDDDYSRCYDDFMIIYSDKLRHVDLKRFCDIFEDEILNSDIIGRHINVAPVDIATYIYFTPVLLRQFNLTVGDLKETIIKNNPDENMSETFGYKPAQNHYFNSKLNSIEDIKKIPLYYKDNSFSTVFGDVFKIETDIKKPVESLTFLGDKPAFIYAIKTNYPWAVYKFKINSIIKKIRKNYPNYVKIEPYRGFKKVSAYPYDDIFKVYQKLKSLDNSAVFILGGDFVKLEKGNELFEAGQNKITILYKNPEIIRFLKDNKINFLKNDKKTKEIFDFDIDVANKKVVELTRNKKTINLASNSTNSVFYLFDNIALNDYFADKKEVFYAIASSLKGITATKYYDNSTPVDVIIKNTDDKNLFLYSKKYGTLVDINALVKKDVKKEYDAIVRKNGRYYFKFAVFD